MFYYHPSEMQVMRDDRYYRLTRKRRRPGQSDRPARPVHKIR